MARFFFHLRDGSDILLDPEGIELPDLAAVRKAALVTARDMLSHGIKEGVLDTHFRVEVEDEAGAVLYRLPFSSAFEVKAA
jgi:hypothetical protein